MKIALTGGGSGGHLMPLVAVVRNIRAKYPEAQFVFIGPVEKMEEDIIGKEGIPMRRIAVGKLRRYFSLENFKDLFKIPFGFLQALKVLFVEMPDVIFSKGGHASVPVVLAGWIYRIPIMIHESDAVPGLANEILSKFADRVAVSYPEAEKEFPASQAVLTGNPLRDDINKGDAKRIKEKLSLLDSKKIIYVTGGSQGSKIINDKIVELLPQLLHKYQVIHHTGASNFDDVKHKAGELGIKAGREGYHIFTFIGDDLKDVYAAADLIISRASSTTISEIAANGKPSILVPLQNAANDHQRMNAYALARLGACMVLEENNLGENLLMSRIEEAMEDQKLRQKLSENIKVFYHPDATERIAQGVLGMIKD